MIVFLVTRAHRGTLDPFLRGRYRPAVEARVMTYEELAGRDEIPLATWIFTDMERLGPAGLELAGRAWRRVADHPGGRALNDPLRVPRRAALLGELRRAGVNRHAAYELAPGAGRGDLPAEDVRYPVFIREADDHTGSLTGLLDDRRQAEAALLALVERGYAAERLLVVEYEDVRGPDGLHRRSAAFVLGGTVIARSRLVSREWVVKAPSSIFDEETTAAELAYVRSNPDAAALARIARLARLDYGRIDYSCAADGLRIWEVNTNPTVMPDPDDPATARRESTRVPAREHFFRLFNARLAELDTPAPDGVGGTIGLDVERSLREDAAREGRERFVASLGRALARARRSDRVQG